MICYTLRWLLVLLAVAAAIVLIGVGRNALLFGANEVVPTSQGNIPDEEAPTLGSPPPGFDGKSNGFVEQAAFDKAREQFEEIETPAGGLGPVYNAPACASCHANPITGGTSQITETRSGHFDGSKFTPSPGGSLIHDRAIHPDIQERVLASQELRGLRASPTLLGLGYIECVESITFKRIADAQPPELRGSFILVSLLEAPDQKRVGRFGWKDQHGSLLSFAADAYVNEMGITSPLQPRENLSNGRSVAAFDTVADPEDKDGEDVALFARFMRGTKPPPRDGALMVTADARAGSMLFDSVGCAACHVRNIRTAPVGTTINGGRFTVPEALGDKVVHPFSDFLLHDVGTGDGIPDPGPASAANSFRTPPLWGLRVKTRLMHDGVTRTRHEAILRHGGQAVGVRQKYLDLPMADKQRLITFLRSL